MLALIKRVTKAQILLLYSNIYVCIVLNNKLIYLLFDNFFSKTVWQENKLQNCID